MNKDYLYFGIYGIIYRATNSVNRKVYIGQTVENLLQRKAKHFQDAKDKSKRIVFHKALNKYGKDNFEWDVIDVAKNAEELNNKEIFWIKHFNSHIKNNKGYNMTNGGLGSVGYKHRIEDVEKMMIIQRKRVESEGYIHPFLGKNHTDETKKTLSKIAEKRFENINNHPWLGRNHSEESKRKMSESQTGKMVGADNPRAEPVVQLSLEGEFIKKYDTLTDGAYSISNSASTGAISRCCSEDLKTIYGYIWIYEKDYNIEYVNYRVKLLNIMRGHSRVVVQLGLDGKFLNRWEEIKQASIAVYGKSSGDSSIINCCQFKSSQAFGYIWLYEEDYNDFLNGKISITVKQQSNKVSAVALDVNYNKVAEKDSVLKLSKFVNIHPETIRRHCRNKTLNLNKPKKHKNTYRFLYLSDYNAMLESGEIAKLQQEYQSTHSPPLQQGDSS
jgi:group I intron endonuclease